MLHRGFKDSHYHYYFKNLDMALIEWPTHLFEGVGEHEHYCIKSNRFHDALEEFSHNTVVHSFDNCILLLELYFPIPESFISELERLYKLFRLLSCGQVMTALILKAQSGDVQAAREVLDRLK